MFDNTNAVTPTMRPADVASMPGSTLAKIALISIISTNFSKKIHEMNRSGKLLSESYTSFVENITAGLGRTIGMFEENMREMTGAMVRDLGAAMNKGGEAPDLKQFARVQQALSDMTQALVRATAAAERMAEGA